MTKGIFEKLIPVDWEYLTDETLRPGGIRVFRNGFSVDIRYPEIHENNLQSIKVRYFSSVKKGRMWVNSFSYSVQHLSRQAQKYVNKNPYRVAKYGLEVVGVAF